MTRDENQTRRRRQIAEAVWQLAVGEGLESVTLRRVADEAGVSMRLVQYYFGTRTQLLVSALELLNEEGAARSRARVGALGEGVPARQLARAVLQEQLPLDDERRRRFTVHAAYFVRFLTDPDLSATAAAADPGLEELIAGLLAGGTPDRDTIADATVLVATATGLQAEVLLGQLAPETAVDLLDRALDRLVDHTPRS